MANTVEERLAQIVQEALGAQLLTICRQQAEIEQLKATLAAVPQPEPVASRG